MERPKFRLDVREVRKVTQPQASFLKASTLAFFTKPMGELGIVRNKKFV